MTFVIPTKEDSMKVFANINIGANYAMAKCACVSCNSCTCACSCRAVDEFPDIW
ncbi:FibroRumin family radical SAM-modified Cys-rich RiPP [Desulfosporosinus sp.]|uniref:FibroRumin family radical SAM-modified Cys-rich RiPP n=1 Tax=Desulfosporosinus sp. TaxID=157907 RepID=UPI0026386D7C|nr:FibroRumin family radical SAM-modified Cys-rich RiPP [Desulfosporosinus sp.]